MPDILSSVKVAVVQAASVVFNREATAQKAVHLVRKAAEQGAKFVLFPEAFIPAYPRGLSFGAVVGSRSPEGRHLWQRYWENSVEVPGPTTDLVAKAAKQNQIYIAIGVIERLQSKTNRTLFCALLYFSPAGELIGLHRKIKPTGTERVIWGEGDGSTLTVIDTEFGVVGGLICWENYMPLARMTMYNKGVDIYLAPTADARSTWQSTLRHIACEGRCFVLGCNQYVTKDMYPPDLDGIQELQHLPNELSAGGSAIINPFGEIIAGPLYHEEGILYSELDMAEINRGKMDLDVAGHYARPDIFKLVVDETPKNSVSFKKA